MKSFLIGILFLFFCLPILNAQEQKKQLWLVSEEVVIPGMDAQYREVNKELLTLCKETNFPFSFNLWTTGDYRYYLWYPVESMNDLQKIESAWDSLVTRYGIEKFDRFNDCVEYAQTGFVMTRPDLSYMPDNPRLKEDEEMYCYYEKFYLKRGYTLTVETLIKDLNKISSESKLDRPVYFAEGVIGYENPVLLLSTFGKDRNDYFNHDKAYWDNLPEQTRETINKWFEELMKYARKYEYKEVWWVKDLSYSPGK